MDSDTLFVIFNFLVLPGWAILLFAPGWETGRRLIAPCLIPMFLGVAYATLFWTHYGAAEGGFGSLDGVSSLFANKDLLLVGWLHYLAFDLFIGSWEIRDSRGNGIPHLLAAPCVILTLVFGPVGLTLYLAVRRWSTGTWSLADAAAGHRPTA